MIVDCPSCGARFLIEPTQIAPGGRKVRCGSCGKSWQQSPVVAGSEAAAPGAAVAAETTAVGSALPRLDEFDEARRRAAARRRPLETELKPAKSILGWAILAVFVVVVLGGFLIGREQITAWLPQTTKLYAALGLIRPEQPKVGEGLELRDVTSVRRLVDGQRTLLIEGSVVNVSNEPQPVPPLRAILTDSGGAEITQWTFVTDGADLPPGGITGFQTSTQDPPSEGNLSLVFVEPE